MEIISGMLKSIYNVMGYQHYDPNKEYKRIPYLVELQENGVNLFCNTLTLEIIQADNEEWESQKDFLVKHWFLVPAGVDPATISYMMRQTHRSRYGRKSTSGLERATILTTTDCNARCSYCYESGCRKRTMTMETAEDVAEYIAAHANKEQLTLKWFGGEPLCNAGAINLICQYLWEHGVEYASEMVTNGLLLNQHSIGQIQRLWRLSRVQVTLDGTKDRYEQIKAYHGVSGAYETVLNNIEMLLQADIRVDVRLNLSVDNYDDLVVLAGELKNRYAKYRDLIMVYAHTLFEGNGYSLTEDERKRTYGQELELRQILADAGIGRKIGIPRIRHTHCMADDGCSVVILPGGELGLCEHHCDDEYIGTIYDAGRKQDVIMSWKELQEDMPECASCFWRPACSRLKKCPGKTECTGAWREYLYQKAQIMMRNAYRKYLREAR